MIIVACYQGQNVQTTWHIKRKRQYNDRLVSFFFSIGVVEENEKSIEQGRTNYQLPIFPTIHLLLMEPINKVNENKNVKQSVWSDMRQQKGAICLCSLMYTHISCQK
jgi:hypothetical protein